MADQAVLDLARSDAEAGRGDHVVVAADEADVAVLVDDALVAGGHPVADELLARGLRPAPIFQEHHRVGPLHRDLPDLARLHRLAVAVDHRHHVPRHRLAHGARLEHAQLRAGAEHQIAFGLAVELVDGQPERRLAPFQRLEPERLAAGGHAAQLDVVAPLRVRRRAHHAQRGRRDEGVAHLRLLQQREGFLRIELVDAARDHRHAVVQARQQHVEQPAGPGPVGRRPVAVACLRKRIMRQFGAGQMSEQHAMAVQRALGLAGGARGVDHHRRIVGRGIDGA